MAPKASVLVTGCSDNGIGSGLALAFQQLGYRVFATTRDPSKMTNLKDLQNVTLLKLDILSSADIADAVEAVKRETGGNLNYLINNAARNHFKPILDEDIEECKRLYNVNVWGPLAVTQAFSPLVIKARGSIAFITSVSGYVNVPYMGTYGGSKRAIEIMAETLRLELCPFHVKVLCVVTAAVQTMGQTYFEDWSLPEGSLYKSIEALIHARVRGEDGVARTPLAKYSQRVASEIIRGRSGRFWCGHLSGGIKFTTTWLPQWVMDSGVVKGTGLDILAKKQK